MPASPARLADHLQEQYDTRVPFQPDASLPLRAFDHTLPQDPLDPTDPFHDPYADPPRSPVPDLDACARAYSLTSPRGLALLGHLASLDRRLQGAVAALERLQRDRRREERAAPVPAPAPVRNATNEPNMPAPYAQTTPNQSLAEVLIANAFRAAGLPVPVPTAPAGEPSSRNPTNEPNTPSREPRSPSLRLARPEPNGQTNARARRKHNKRTHRPRHAGGHAGEAHGRGANATNEPTAHPYPRSRPR